MQDPALVEERGLKGVKLIVSDKCSWLRKLNNLTWRKKPVKLTWKGWAFYEKVVWLQIQKSCSIGSAALETDRAEIAGK